MTTRRDDDDGLDGCRGIAIALAVSLVVFAGLVVITAILLTRFVL